MNPFRRLPLAVAGILLCARLGSAQTAQTPSAQADSLATSSLADALQADQSVRGDTRTQYPAFLNNSYFSVSLGYIQYDFSALQLEPGFGAQSVDIPHTAARVALLGHQFNRFLSAQVTYMRPVQYVSYVNVNGDRALHTVWAHFGGATLRPQIPVHTRVSVAGEVGVGITSRRGFDINGLPAVKDANFSSLLVGAGVDFHLTRTWDLIAGATYSPRHLETRQPRTVLWSGGFRFNMRALPAERVTPDAGSGALFPKNVVQVEYASGVGYAVNDLFSKKVPIFWGGLVRVARGGAVHYQRSVFHTRKVFDLDLGASASVWRSRGDSDTFVTLSLYPLLRWTVIRTAPADLYLCYSLAGPSYISQTLIDGLDTGRRFTFQDFMGMGVFLGRNRRISAGVKINHYSNGNIFTRNAGVKVPLTFHLGYTF